MTGPRSVTWRAMIRPPNSLANLTAYVRPAREQSEKSTGTKIVRISRCCPPARDVDEVFIFSFTIKLRATAGFAVRRLRKARPLLSILFNRCEPYFFQPG